MRKRLWQRDGNLNPSLPKPVSKKQKESVLQLGIINALNKTGAGYFFRIRNGATFDPTRKIFRSNVAEKGIPDIIGFLKDGTLVAIEVKYIELVEKKKKLTFSVKITDEQKLFLQRAYSYNARAGVAFNIEDALAIVYNNEAVHLRHPRTFSFMPDSFRKTYEEEYKPKKRAMSEKLKDPLHRDILINPVTLLSQKPDPESSS